jgi:DNA-binding NarL/FixJ family response regulator
MPNLTGDALARELLSIRPDLPIILCTGFSYTVTPEKATALGIRAFLMKPILSHELAQTIQRVLG